MHRIPDPGSEREEEGSTPPADKPAHAGDHGVTMAEQREGGTINTRVEEEEPEREPVTDPSQTSADPYPADLDERAGRVVASDEGSPVDAEGDSVGYNVGTDSGAFSGEERAMHLDPEGEP